jgi:hypothetical protein
MITGGRGATTIGAGTTTTGAGIPRPTDTCTLAYAGSGRARVVRLNKVTMPNVQRARLARFIVFVFLLVNYAKPFLPVLSSDHDKGV